MDGQYDRMGERREMGRGMARSWREWRLARLV